MRAWIKAIGLLAVMQPVDLAAVEPLALGHLLSICGSDASACGGYIIGVVDQYLTGDQGALCLPGNFSGSTAVIALSHYVRGTIRDGAGLTDPAPHGIIAALKARFPCDRWFRHVP